MNADPSLPPSGSPGQCPKCGAALPENAPLGLCPACLLAAAAAPATVVLTTAPQRPEPPPIDELRAAFPQLEILELIGQGGMGVVYKARQPKLDRLVALKILPESLAKDASFEERFTREARTLAKLSHPNIVAIYDHGHAGAFFYLVMEFVDGVNLRQAMSAGKFTPAEALALVPRICEALQYAHEEGVLHRDIKPENILLDAKGRVKIADFGIAKMLGDAVPGHTLTASGASLGTPQYMAPEQIEHPSDVDHRADIFSLGVVFYEMLTGELPLGRFGPPSAKSAVDRRVDEIVFRTLEKERALRQQSAAEVKTQVEGLGPDANLRGAVSGFAPRNRATAGQSAPRALKGQNALIFTPEVLGTFAGQMLGYRHRGQVLLDEECLTLTQDGMPAVIPLSAIQDLSVGQFPRVMNPVGIDLLSITFDDAGTVKRLFVAPMIGFIGLPSTWNSLVAEWHLAIRNAVIAATGRAPSTTPTNELGIPRSSGLIQLLILVGFIVGVGLGLVAFGGSRLTAPELVLACLVVVFFVFVPCATLIALFRRGRRPSKFRMVMAVVVGPFILLPGLMALVWMLRTANSRPPASMPLSRNHVPVPATTPPIQPPPSTVLNDVSPLAHLTNALRVPFSLEPKRVGRFWLEGPQRVTVSAQSTWDGTLETHAFSPIEGERTFSWNNTPVPPLNAFVPYAGTPMLEPRDSPTGFSVTVVTSDTGITDGELIWEPILGENPEAPFQKWRCWVAVKGAPVICSEPLDSPISLSRRFAFPRLSLSHLTLIPGPLKSYWVTPLDLLHDSTTKPSAALPNPTFNGPTFEQWYPELTNALAQAIADVKSTYGAPTNRDFRFIVVTNGPVWFQIQAPPVALESRWEYQLQQFWGAFTLSQAEFTNRFPIYESQSGRAFRVPSGPGQRRTEIPDWIGTNYLRNAYQKAAARAEEKLTLKAAVDGRLQSSYFPNDRVRIGLMVDEAEILAAIRSGSTNQVFGAVAQP